MNNFGNALATRVAQTSRFKAAYEELQRASLSDVIGSKALLNVETVSKLARSALILAQASDVKNWTLAQDIAYALASLSLTGEQRQLCSHVLATLGNFPAADFLLPASTSRTLPWTLQLDEGLRKEDNTIQVLGKESVLTDFQADIWDGLNRSRYLSVSAPTSAGKSFVLQAFILDALESYDGFQDIIYLVPTRSLIQEVSASLGKSLAPLGEKVVVSSVPMIDDELNHAQSRVLVFTQERLRTALDRSHLEPAIIIIDEAQQIADEERGMLLLNCLEEIIRRSPGVRLLFITPSSKSAASMNGLLDLKRMLSIQSDLKPVRQNLIYVTFQARAKQISLRLHRPGLEPLDIGAYTAKRRFLSKNKRLIDAAIELGGGGQSLVYAGGPDSAEKIALAISEHMTEATLANADLETLSEFVAEHVHPDYALVESVLNGVGYHYGHMPSAISTAVEQYFRDNKLPYLVCTSTLLQGVNLPARNIFLHKPTKGKGNPISGSDFWNLAGRAGRMQKDTHGNVFLVEYEDWESKPVEENERQEVVSSLSHALKSRQSEIIDYARDPKHPSGTDDYQFVESVFCRLFTDAKLGRFDETVRRATFGEIMPDVAELRRAIFEQLDRVTLPIDVIAKNNLISPVRQQALFDFFDSSLKGGRYRHLIPPHPMRENAAELLTAVMRISRIYLEGVENKLENFFGWFSIHWMNGTGLKNIIQMQIDYEIRARKEKGDETPVNSGTVIRETLKSIDKFLRFHYVKYLGCYINILQYALASRGIPAASEIPAIPLFLELGASNPVMIQAMSLGLSRVAAKEVSRLFPSSPGAPALRLRLRSMSKEVQGRLPRLVLAELQKFGLVRA
ncbi:DEAD/DEAH box helicase domain protein [Burkholderia sp. BT03]|nr:DEAD/DEAH box helicase domain protein [Burkholderia sp. BT03]